MAVSTIFRTNQCEILFLYYFSIQHRDENSRPLDNESPPITTRAASAQKNYSFFSRFFCSHFQSKKAAALVLSTFVLEAVEGNSGLNGLFTIGRNQICSKLFRSRLK